METLDSFIDIPKKISQKWQKLLDNLIVQINVSDALITRIDFTSHLKIFKASENKENPFKKGEVFKLTNHYCEDLIKNNSILIIPNALENPKWKSYFEVKLGLIAYMGLLLKWPDGKIFGSLCVHDTKEKSFCKKIRQIMLQARDLIEAHLEILYQNKLLLIRNEEKKEMKKNFNNCKNKFKSIYDHIEYGICLQEIVYEEGKPVDYRILDANPAFEKILGISISKAKDRLASELFASEKAPYLQIYARVAETGKSLSFEDYFSPMDKYFHITVTSSEKGKFNTLFYDITDSKEKEQKTKESERKYKTLFNRAPIGVFRTNSKGVPLSINPAMAEMLGYSSTVEALDNYENLSKNLYVNPERRTEFIEQLKDKGEVKNFVYEAVRADGTHIWLSMNARVSREYINGIFIIEGFAYDITDQKRYANELQNQKEELQAANEQLTAYNEEITAMNEELDQSIHEINELNERFVNMINLVSKVDENSNNNEEDFLSDLLESAINIVPEADYGKICIVDNNKKYKFIDAIGHDIETLKKVRINKSMFFHDDDSEIYISDEYSIDIENTSSKVKNEFESGLKPISKSISINLIIDDEVKGRLSLDMAEGNNKEFSETTKRILKSFAILASSFFSFKRYDKLKEQFINELIISFNQILEMHDKYTSGHSENVAKLGMELAREMELSEQEIEDTYWSGIVHDIGKLLISLDIINKEGALTDEEYELIKKHSYWSYKSLSKADTLQNIAQYVLHHHERWDGKGYPEGLKGEEIPTISQILILADAWDAMNSNRSYRSALKKKKALKEIKENKGTQFSPKVVQAFLSYFEKNELSETKVDD